MHNNNKLYIDRLKGKKLERIRMALQIFLLILQILRVLTLILYLFLRA